MDHISRPQIVHVSHFHCGECQFIYITPYWTRGNIPCASPPQFPEHDTNNGRPVVWQRASGQGHNYTHWKSQQNAKSQSRHYTSYSPPKKLTAFPHKDMSCLRTPNTKKIAHNGEQPQEQIYPAQVLINIACNAIASTTSQHGLHNKGVHPLLPPILSPPYKG